MFVTVPITRRGIAQPPPGQPRSRIAASLLAVLIVFFVVTNTVWIFLDHGPVQPDEANYLELSHRMYTALRQGRWSDVRELFFAGLGGAKAPLIAMLPLPMYFLFGSSADVAVMTNTVLLVVFCLVFYRLVLALRLTRPAALLAVAIANTMPLIYGVSRLFYTEYALTVCVAVWMYCLVKSSLLTKTRWVIALGVIGGLGFLLKVTFPLFVFFPTLVVLWQRWLTNRRHYVRQLGTVVFLTGLIAGPWYAANFLSVSGYAYALSAGSVARPYRWSEVLSLGTLTTYWLMVINLGMSVYYFGLALGLAAIFGWRRFRRRITVPATDLTFRLLIGWIAVPSLVFTLGLFKDVRHLAPALPAFAGLLAVLATACCRVRPAFVLSSFVVFPWYAYLHTSFGVLTPPQLTLGGRQQIPPAMVFSAAASYTGLNLNTVGDQQFAVDRLLVVSRIVGYAYPPRPRWPVVEILNLLDQDFAAAPVTPNTVAVVPSIAAFNPDNFRYYRLLTIGLVRIAETPFGELPVTRATDAGYIVIKTGVTEARTWVHRMNLLLSTQLAEGGVPFRRVGHFSLPDGSSAIIYRRNFSPANVSSAVGLPLRQDLRGWVGAPARAVLL